MPQMQLFDLTCRKFLFLPAFLLALFLTTECLAQKKDEDAKWGQVTAEERAMMTYPSDPEAEAVILLDHGIVQYNLRPNEHDLVNERHIRIKFLTQAGIEEYGDAIVQYYTYEKSEVLASIKAQVHLPNGTTIEAGKENMFTSKDGEYVTSTRISFPGLQPGAIAEYKYVINSSRTISPVDWFFQREIPIVSSDLQVIMPDLFQYAILKQGIPPQIETLTQAFKNINFAVGGGAVGSINARMNTWHFAASNMPAMREEKFITSMRDYYARVRFQLQSVTYPNTITQNIFDTWQRLENELLDHELFGEVYTSVRNGNIMLEAAGIAKDDSRPKAVLARELYDYVSREFRQTGDYGYLMDAWLPEIMKKKEGSGGTLNLMLLAGLRALDINAAPVLVSTRAHGKWLELYPFVRQFNHVLVVAELDGKQVFMDIDDRLHPMGMPRKNSLNYRGWAVRKGGSAWIDINPEQSKSTYYYQLHCAEDGSLSGTLQGKVTGYFAIEERRAFFRDTAKYYKDAVSSASHTWEIAGIKTKEATDRYQPWSFSANLSAKSNLEGTDFLYISPAMTMEFLENPLKAEVREYPVEFNYPFSYKVIMDLHLPKGYVVETLPGSRRVVDEEGGIGLTYNTSETQGKVQIVFDYNLSKCWYGHDQYGMLKELFQQITDIASEQIVIRKA